jgi:hypothetical protein
MPCSAAIAAARGIGLALPLLQLLLLQALLMQPLSARAEGLPGPVPLRCQIRGGPWRDCQMRVQRLGEQWTLVVGRQHYAFRHDGKGSIRMQAGKEPWVQVQPRWNDDAALCWDGICAQGDLPLD